MQGGKEGHIAVSGDCTVAVNGGMDARCGQLTPHPVDALFFFQAEDGIRDIGVTGVQTCLPIFTAIVLITIGSASAKRQSADQQKFKTMLIWFSVGLVVILVAIPWPFSPLAARPYLRLF